MAFRQQRKQLNCHFEMFDQMLRDDFTNATTVERKIPVAEIDVEVAID